MYLLQSYNSSLFYLIIIIYSMLWDKSSQAQGHSWNLNNGEVRKK